MVNGPPCAVCGFTLRWLPQQNSWGCDRCQRMFPAQPQAAPAPSPWAQPYQQQGFGRPPQQPQPQPPPQPPPQASPYAPQPHGYGQPPPQQQPYTPHPPQPVPPVAAAGGKQGGGKGLLIGGVVAAVAIAGGIVAFVMLRGGGGTKGGDGRDAIVKSTLAALGDGDADQLVKLADPAGVLARFVDCTGKTKPRNPDDANAGTELSERDKEDRDPKKQVEKRKQEFEEAVALSKGAKIQLVEVTSKVPDAPRDDEKEAEGLDGTVVKSGQMIFKGCFLKEPMRFHVAKLKVKTTPKGEKDAIESETEMTLLQFGKGFYLAALPHVNLGSAALERELTAMKDKVCACDKAECAQKLKDAFKDSPRYKDIKKQIKAMSEKDQERIEKLDDEIKACERKLEGGEQLAAMTQFKDKMCACIDQACVDKVSQEMTVYGKSHSDTKLSEDDLTKATALGEEMARCMTKVAENERMRNPPPDTTNGGGIGATIAESTGVTADAPPACIAYEKILDELLACSKFPQNQHASIEESRKQLQQSYKDYKRLPKASQQTIDDVCTQGSDAMRQTLTTIGC